MSVSNSGAYRMAAPGCREQSLTTTTEVSTPCEEKDAPPGCCRALRLSLTYTTADLRRRPRNLVIGLIATLLLVFFSGLVLVGIDKAPYVLLRLAELSAGEMDIVLFGGGRTQLINFTDIHLRIMQSEDVHGASPRWMLRGTLRAQAAAHLTSNISEFPSTSATVIVADTAHEKAVGIGRAWPYRQIGYGEAQIYYSAAEYINVTPNIGQRVNVNVDVLDLLTSVGGDPDGLALNVTRPKNVTDAMSFYLNAFFELNDIPGDSVNILDLASTSIPATMADAIASADGKYASAVGNVVLMDIQQLLPYLVDGTCLLGAQTVTPSTQYFFPTYADLLNVSVVQRARTFRLEDAAMIVVGMFTDRYDMYYAEASRRDRLMTAKSNSMMKSVGLDFDGQVQFPLAAALDAFDTFKVLLISSFIAIVVAIIVLGCLLMFALLRINADERQFELAMIRAQGMPKNQVAAVLITQTLAFNIPGTAIGVGLVIAANAVLEAALSNFTKAPARAAHVSIAGVVTSVVLGLVLPLIATWRPVKSALGSSLRDALDVYREAQNETKIVMQRLENIGLAPRQVALGLFLTVAGFIIYYLMPMSFIFENMLMFFILLDVILICLVGGLCMMLFVLEPYAERGVLYLLLWGKERRLKALIEKNLRSHRQGNATAFLMFMLSVAGLLSAGVMFTVLAHISADLTELMGGAPVTVASSAFDTPLDRDALDAFLRGDEGSRYAAHWSYRTFDLSSYPQIDQTYIQNAVGSFWGIAVTAVSETFMDSVYPQFNMVDSYDKRYPYPANAFGSMDVIRSMYARDSIPNNDAHDIPFLATGLPPGAAELQVQASSRVVMPTVLAAAGKSIVGLDIGGRAWLSYVYHTNSSASSRTQVALEPRAFMDRVSGFVGISSLPLGFQSGSLIITEPHFAQLLSPIDTDLSNASAAALVMNGPTTLRYKYLYIQLKDGLTKKARERFVNALQSRTNVNVHTTTDNAQVVEGLHSVRDLILSFFYFTAVVCIILCAFMMWVTFISNVQLNVWSIGVLRSLGFRLPQLIRASIYEALCIVISAFVFGAIAGVLIGLTVSAELTQILVLPFAFDVPYVLILIVLVLALLAAIVGSTLPFIDISRRPISTVLRGV